MSQSIPISSSPQHARFIPPPSSRSRSSSNANSGILSSSPGHYLSSSPSASTMMEHHKRSSSSPLSKEEEELMNQKKERFQTCKEVIDRLMWDESLADVMQNLSMIYKDRFEGDVFISYNEYENSELKDDLPQHRIQSLIYRDEHVFWDKNKRIDLITSKEIFPLVDSYLNPNANSETTQEVEVKKKKKKNSKPSISLEKSKASTLYKTTSGEDLDEEEDEIDQYLQEYDEEYGMYLK